jgi:tRNA/rRNA methyltransferase
MLSKNQIKLIQKLQQKKYRSQLGLFVVEGKKSITEFLLSGYQAELIAATTPFSAELSEQPFIPISAEELKKNSSLQNPDDGIAIFRQQSLQTIPTKGILLALDNVQDPGNLGTIIRLADWFGIETLLCNTHTVDCYNPKVVQASMGSLARVSVHYLPLADFLASCPLPKYATILHGSNLYTTHFPSDCVIVMGNEANGIGEEIQQLCNQAITIPQFSRHQRTESLNVATATAIILSQVVANN